MKNLINKVRHHGKKITIHLKRHHRKYLFGALCSGLLALIAMHTASTINNIFANEEPITPSITYNPDANITYIDTEGREFTGIGTITISNGEDSITMLDRNLGATEKGTGENSYGYYFQYGNNFGFSHNSLNNTGEQKVNISPVGGESYEWNNPYVSDIFIMGSGNGNRTYSRKTNIWGGSGDSESTNYYQTVENAYERQGPCPAGYHIPSAGEWAKLIKMFHDLDGNGRLYDDDYYGHYLYYIYNKDYHNNFLNSFYMPYNGNIDYYQGKLFYTGTESILWSSSTRRKNEADDSVIFYARSDDYTRQYGIRSDESSQRANGISIRCFKDSIGSSITLSFNTNGGTKIQSQTLSVGSNGYLPGYTTNKPDDELIGWFLDRDFSQPFSFDIPLYEDTLIYAKWLNNNWIDDVIPVCIVEYDITGPTNQDVVAYLTGCSEEITTEENEYTFTGNGTHTFEFQDLVGNTGEAIATVDRIDKVAPTCDVEYSTTGVTTGNVVASLTGCNKTIRGADLQYTFTENGTYTFEFQDLFGNTGSANATVTWIERGDTYENAKSLYNEYKEITCSGSYNSGGFDSQFSIYLNSGMLSQRSSSTYSGKTNVDYLLAKDDLMCFWGDSYGRGYGVCTDYHFNIESIMGSMFPMSTGNDSVSCEIGLQDTGLFVLPDDITFNIVGQNNFALSGMFHNSANSFGVDSFYIKIPESFDVGEAVDFSVRAMKDGKTFTGFFGLIFISLKDEDGNDVKEKYYTLSDGAYYQFISDDLGKKTFEDGLIVKKEGKYILRVDSIYGGMGDFEIVVGERNDEDDNEDNDDFEYDTLKFNPYFSDEDNMAYQYAYHYGITTTSSIKNANMYSGLNRIAMAKMLSSYAENVLGMDDFDTSRNCKFADVSTSLDASYGYGVTKACQLGIMGVNVPNNRFYPNGRVTRAEFATALSRLLYNTEDGVDNYYTTHINKLRREGIITNTNPQLWEKRGFVMLMLMRAGEIYDD